MEPMEKLWHEVDGLKESKTRHDERIKRLESDHKETMKHLSAVETSIDDFRTEIRDGFRVIGERIDDIEGKKREHDGYQKGQMDALKKFGLWLTIAALAGSFFAWWLTR